MPHTKENEGKYEPPCYGFCQWLHDGCEQEPEQYEFCKQCVIEALEIFEREQHGQRCIC